MRHGSFVLSGVPSNRSLDTFSVITYSGRPDYTGAIANDNPPPTLVEGAQLATKELWRRWLTRGGEEAGILRY